MPPPPQQGPPPVTIDAVMALLRDGAMRSFRIDIEVDSTITGDESQERQDRTQFIDATTKFIQAWGPIVAEQPLTAQLAGELLLFGTRAFRVGRSLEEVIEETVDKLEQQAAQPKPPPPIPPEEQAKIQQAQIKAQAEGQKGQMEMQIKQIEAQAKQQQVAMEAQAKQQELAMQQQAQKMDMILKMLEHRQAVEVHHMDSQRAERDHQLSMEVAEHKAKEAKKPKGQE
jgi:hypothetical protein